MTVHDLPALNAALNGLSAVLLFLARRAVKRGREKLHQRLMESALVSSAFFLTSYLYYHFNVGAVTHYQKTGLLKALYFFILLTHTPLATLMVPFILAAVWFAYRGRFDIHTRITRRLWPVWIYVSVTGVVIYLMLYVF